MSEKLVEANDPMAKYRAAMEMVHALCTPRGLEGHREWEMSIPARPDHDPDIVIVNALHALRDAWTQAKCRLKKAEARAELDKLGHSLAYESAVSIIDSESLKVGPEDEDWREVEVEGEVELFDAVRYLEMRGLLERHPEHANWVSVRDESEGTSCGS